jgi:hypothetical protein
MRTETPMRMTRDKVALSCRSAIGLHRAHVTYGPKTGRARKVRDPAIAEVTVSGLQVKATRPASRTGAEHVNAVQNTQSLGVRGGEAGRGTP